jgi:Tfp pilus assembly protein PilN
MTLRESKLMHNQKDHILEELKNKVISQSEEIESLTIQNNKFQTGLNISGISNNDNSVNDY